MLEKHAPHTNIGLRETIRYWFKKINTAVTRQNIMYEYYSCGKIKVLFGYEGENAQLSCADRNSLPLRFNTDFIIVLRQDYEISSPR